MPDTEMLHIISMPEFPYTRISLPIYEHFQEFRQYDTIEMDFKQVIIDVYPKNPSFCHCPIRTILQL